MQNTAKIATIVHLDPQDTLLIDVPDVELYNIVDSIDKVDNTKPVLYIGFNKTNILFNNKLNILNNKINHREYWSFSKEEKMLNYFDIIEKFKNYAIEYYIERYNYVPFNNFFFKETNVLDYIKSKNIYRVFTNERSIYFYFDKEILGIDLFYLYYMERKLAKEIIKLAESYKDILLNDDRNEKLNYFKEKLPNYSDCIEKFIGVIL